MFSICLLVIQSVVACDEVLQWYKKHNLISFFYTLYKFMFIFSIAIYLSAIIIVIVVNEPHIAD